MDEYDARVEAGVRVSGELRSNWKVLVFATVGAGLGFSALGYTLGPLIVPLQHEFGWGRGQITLAALWSSLGMAFALPFVGPLLDRFGVKRVAAVSLPLFALAIFALGRFDGSLWLFLFLYGVTGVLGVGTSAVTYAKAVVERFDSRRGLALGIMATGLGVAGLALPPLIAAVIASGGWRNAYLVLSLLALAPLLLLAITRIDSPTLRSSGQTVPGGPSAPTIRSTLATREFWTLVVSFFLLGWALLSMIPHFIPMLIDTGVDPVRAALLASFVGVGTVIGRPLLGWLIDRYYATHIAIPMFVAAALGCVLLLVGGPQFAPLTALLIGIGFGAEIDLMSYLSSRYIHPLNFGALYSYIYAAFMVGSAIGPVVAGFIFDSSGSYRTALMIAATFLCLGSFAIATLPRYRTIGAITTASVPPIESTSELSAS
ncbi:MFS transporter [Rhodococcus erythropolis]|uniref:MFS transporter n=1 Tax=Rhodococcus erythropolis TaxID=1833 RepID=UPI003800C04B